MYIRRTTIQNEKANCKSWLHCDLYRFGAHRLAAVSNRHQPVSLISFCTEQICGTL